MSERINSDDADMINAILDTVLTDSNFAAFTQDISRELGDPIVVRSFARDCIKVNLLLGHAHQAQKDGNIAMKRVLDQEAKAQAVAMTKRYTSLARVRYHDMNPLEYGVQCVKKCLDILPARVRLN